MLNDNFYSIAIDILSLSKLQVKNLLLSETMKKAIGKCDSVYNEWDRYE